MTNNLNMRVGTAMGYRVEPFYHPVNKQSGFVLIDPTGDIVHDDDYYWASTEQRAWKRMPDYAGDIESALGLIDEFDYTISAHSLSEPDQMTFRYHVALRFRMSDIDYGLKAEAAASATSLSEAICEAFLMSYQMRENREV